MTTRSVSPGAALLRTSRLFSMPAPIPAATGEFASATKRHSPTATIPYPTHLTVTTPSSSRATGDWGFKRPLPLKTTTKTTLPLVRVRAVDSIEHVTDFQSASDHTITLHKFQELNLPITIPQQEDGELFANVRVQKSVFEEDSDVTAIPKGREEEFESKRWRFKGPWLAGMTDGDFEKYLEKTVRARRSEFRTLLRERLAAEMTEDQARDARDMTMDPPKPVAPEDVTEKQLTAYMKRLRSDPFELYQVVGRFLDLAPLIDNLKVAKMQLMKKYNILKTSPYSSNGPPITHPSAGLSYLRTRNFQENHPLYGPQRQHLPIEARVVMPTHVPSGIFTPVVGVGGFIAKTDMESSFNTKKFTKNRGKDQGLYNLDLETEGGAKKFVDVSEAHIDPTGKVILRVNGSELMPEVVQKEMLGQSRTYEEALKRAAAPEIPRIPRRDVVFRRGNSSIGGSQSYGLSGSDFGRAM